MTIVWRHSLGENEKEKIKRERREKKWRRAGKENLESPREMLAQLEAKFASAREPGEMAPEPASQAQ